MEVISQESGKDLVIAAVTEKEWVRVPSEIAKKLENYIGEKFDELITARALLETKSFNAVHALSELQGKHDAQSKEHEEMAHRLESSNKTIAELEKQLSSSVGDVNKFQMTCNKLEQEVADLRNSRNELSDERDELNRMISRKNAEIERMQVTINSISDQLTEAVNAKCEVMEKMNEVDSMKLSIEYKEKRLEQEKNLLNSQVKNLTEDLERKTEELLNMRRDNTSRCVQLEIKLNEKIQELSAVNESAKLLTETNSNLVQKLEEMGQKLLNQKEKFDGTIEAFEHQIDSQKKMADLYKDMSDEKTKHAEELSDAVQVLKEKLDDALEKYGDLETRFKESELAHEEVLNKKAECINLLKKELDSFTEMQGNSKSESMQREVEEMSPGASAASRLIKTGLTMTELYSQYVQATESLALEKVENNRLQSYIHSIIQELEEKGPLIAKQREDYEQSLEAIEELTKKYDNLVNENQTLRDSYNEAKRAEASVSRENTRMKREISDLSRQICHLLREVEHSRAGSSSMSEQDLSDSTSSADIITKRLVTFSDITELQSTNQRLLQLVRELSTKQEEAELIGGPEMFQKLKMQLENLKESNAELLQQLDSQSSALKRVMEQRDTYKTMCSQFIKGNIKEMQLENDKSQSPKAHDESDMQVDDTKLQELEQELDKTKKELNMLKEELDTYKKEKSINDKILIEQNEKMRSEVQELMRQNTKLITKCETLEETIKIHKNNSEVYKDQIQKLEERNRIYNDSIVKYETAQGYLKDQTLEAHTKLSKAEVALSNLQKENMLLREAELRLTRELEILKRDTHSQAKLHTTVELIKATIERTDAENKIRKEEALTEAHRECAAIRRRLQEEQDRFRQMTEHLEKQTQIAQTRMQEEKKEAEKFRAELMEARSDLAAKSTQLEELSKKLKNSLLSDAETGVESKKYRELENLLNDKEAEIESMKQKVKIAKEAVEHHTNIAQAAEQQLIDLNEVHTVLKANYEKTLAERDAKITELEEKCSDLQGELSLQSDGQVNVASNLHTKLNKLEIQHKVTLNDLADATKELEAARTEIKNLNQSLESAENKYTREMTLHSADLQSLKAAKDELSKVLEEVNNTKHERDRAQQALEESKASWLKQEEHFKKEKGEMETRLKDLDKQNTLLLDQLQELNTQMSLMQSHLTEGPLNKSATDTSFNRSFTEDEVRSSEQLLKIIKYLRQEKDIALSKCEILDAEFVRLKTQHEVLQKQFDEVKSAADLEKERFDVTAVTTAKHAEVLRKVETLNAITDSNRSLRAERNELHAQVQELAARTQILEDQIAPLQEKNKELQKKAEAMQQENITLRSDSTRWRQRANMLIEKSNRTSPEDWKKLQNERENLAKQLTIEKANVSKLTDEVNTLSRDKQKLEENLKHAKNLQEQQKMEIEKLNDELTSVKAQVNSLTQELDQARSNVIRISEENRTLTENVSSKDTALTDLKNNFAQIRKIAKKYKIQAEEQSKEIETLKQDKKEDVISEEKREELIQLGRSQQEERITQLEQSHNERVSELNEQLSTMTAENEKNKKKNEHLKERMKTTLEKEERFKVLFKNAKDHIVNLTEQINVLKAQKDSPSKSDTSQQSTSTSDVDKFQKEKEEILAEKQQERERYVQEIETLTQRINQLQRQLGLQQGSKPSTSSEKEKSTTEPPTANIKPMAGHSTNTQTQSVPIQPWRSGGEPPLASIRPMSMQLRTVAVLPTSQSPSTVVVPPQQQVVHTTGSSGIEAMSSSPTSSHTDYVPATSSASSAMLGPRQAAVPPTQSSQDTEDEDNNMQVQQAPQQQAVALVLPRVEPPSPAQEQGTSSSSSNTVTTTQAGHKRPREADETQHEDQGKTQQPPKRTRILQGTSSGAEGSVSESGVEVEYQVPTSSQRDHEEDAVIVVESDEEGPDEGEGEDYNMPYEDPDTQDPDQDDEGGNEVEVIDDSSEVPNHIREEVVGGECEEAEAEEETMQPEATSSGTNVSTSVAVTLPSFSRTRPVAPLSRQQQTHLLLPHGIEEGGDDGIVPSTPTLFVARRCDGFGEAVSSPHVPTSGRFTFTESGTPNNIGSNDVLPEQTLEMANVDDNSTGRSVPSTPLQTSPHESGPSGEEQPAHQEDIPSITVSGAEDEAEASETNECMGPPSVAGTSSTEISQASDQNEEMQEGDDGVSSEGEKAASTEEGEEEGREAEASPSTNTRSRNIRGTPPGMMKRSMRQTHVRGISRSGPTPIVWSEQLRNQRQDMVHRGRGMQGQQFSPRTARRSRGRGQRNPYGRF